MAFVNRDRELSDLEAWWASSVSRPALVWGRRRVGKTALIQRFAGNRRAVFHTGAGRSAAGELLQLSRQARAAGVGGLRDLASRPYGDWDDALEHLAGAAEVEPLLLVLDEYPELERASPELPGVIRAFLERSQGRTRLRLLICGSAVRAMQAMQEERAPLYGRFDLRVHVHPFAPWEAALLLPGLAPRDQALVYGLLGGMPLYLSWWEPERSVADNLRQLACRPGAPLLTEGDLVLATEAEGSDRPSAVLHAIASGKTRYNEIKDWIRAEPARTLDRLIQLRLVERLVPVTDDPARTRRRIYRVSDNFLAFHLGLLSRYRDEIDRGLGESILPLLLAGLDQHLGGPWEQAFRDHVRRASASGRYVPDVVAVGPWWREGGQDEIDAVALAGLGREPALVGEAKWTKNVDGSRVLHTLRAKAAVLAGNSAALAYLIAAREHVTDLPRGAVAVTAADIFATS